MIQIEPDIAIQAQLDDPREGSIILVNHFQVAPGNEDLFMTEWRRDSLFMKQQPGYLSAQLHRGAAGSGVWVNYAEWESMAAIRTAIRSDAFQELISRQSHRGVPKLYYKVAIQDICLGGGPAA